MNSTFFKNINNWQDFDDKLSSLGNKEKAANQPKVSSSEPSRLYFYLLSDRFHRASRQV